MRQRSLSFLILMSLLIAPLLAAAPEALRTPAHEVIVHTTDVAWSGNMTLDEDITIASGATLTIAAGTNINITEDITIRIEGDLDIDGTVSEPVIINGSYLELTSIQARWEGFQIVNGGMGQVTSLELSDARGGFKVEAGGQLTIDTSTFEDVIIGVWAIGDVDGSDGPSSGTDLMCTRAGTACLRVDGTTQMAHIDAISSGAAVIVGPSGDLRIDGTLCMDCGTALVLEAGSTFRGNTSAYSVTTVISVTGTVDAEIDNLEIHEASGTLVSSTDGSGLIIHSASMGDDTASLTNGIIGTVQDIEILHGSIESTRLVDAQIDGTLRFGDIALEGSEPMLLRGGGEVILDGTTLTGGAAFDAVGSGELTIIDSDLQSSDELGIISGWDLDVEDSMFTTDSQGLRLLSGSHEFDNVTISRQFSAADTTSVGLDIVWADVELDDVTITGFNEGVRCMAQCTLHGDSLSAGGGGRDSGAGLVIADGGSVSLDSLSTSSSDVGIDLVDGDVHLSEWTVDFPHRSYGIELANDASAVIRDMPGLTSSGAYDGFGDGTLLWGSTGSPDLAVSVEEQFTESNIRVTDVVGTALADAEVSAHGFTEIADSLGDSSLPLLSSGSLVEALDPSSGMGTSAIMMPPGGTLQIAVIPTSGDWTIPTGVHAILSGDDFVLNGDLIIEGSASLMLIDATLTLPDAANLTIQSNGQLKGDSGSLLGGVASLTAGIPFVGSGSGLTVGSDLTFTCYDPWTWVLTDLTGDLTLGQDCELILDDGHATGVLMLGTDAIHEELTHLTVTVVDAGTVVEGAVVSVDGAVIATDVNGESLFTSTYRIVDGGGETLAGLKTVVVQHANINRYHPWDPSSSDSIEMMISTVTPGATTGLVRLEPIFSPWHLGGGLLVSSGTTLDVLPNVELTIAPGVGITIEGVMRAEDAWIGGTGSNGLTTRNGGLLTMQAGFYSGGPILSGAETILSDMSISDAHLIVESAGAMTVIDGTVSSVDICVRVHGSLSMQGTTLEDCDMFALWATAAALEVTDIVLGSGNSNGAWIQMGSGNLTDIDGTAHDGDGSVIHLELVTDALTVSGLNLSVGSGEAALRVEQAEDFILSDSIVSGALAVLIENSDMTLLRVELHGDGSGRGIEVLGTPTAGTIIEDCNIDDYAVAVRLEGGLNDIETLGVRIVDTELHATVAIDANTLPFTMDGGVLDGAIEMLGIDKSWAATVVDLDPSDVAITGLATLSIAHTWTVASNAPIQLSMTTPEFEAMIGEQQHDWDDPNEIVLSHRAFTESGMTDVQFASWSATSPGFLPVSGQLEFDPVGERILDIEMVLNSVPVVVILTPVGDTEINAGDVFMYTATATDADDDEIVEWIWLLVSLDESFLLGDTSSGGTDAIEQGEWTLRAIAIDSNGGQGMAEVHLSVNPADADGDFTETCPATGPNAWWDAANGWYCGPNVYDIDDDNDGVHDESDRFPWDACAHRDTDNDGLPDSIVAGCETNLDADDDDDDDGVPDSEDIDPTDASKGRASEEAEERSLFATIFSPGVVLTAGVVIVFTVFAFLRSRAGEDEF